MLQYNLALHKAYHDVCNMLAGCSMGSLASQQALRDCTILSSVYYDNDIMQSYTSRLLRDDRSTSTRIRFYGPRTRSASQQVFVERKMHREPWTGEQSCKVVTGDYHVLKLPWWTATDSLMSVGPQTSQTQFVPLGVFYAMILMLCTLLSLTISNMGFHYAHICRSACWQGLQPATPIGTMCDATDGHSRFHVWRIHTRLCEARHTRSLLSRRSTGFHRCAEWGKLSA